MPSKFTVNGQSTSLPADIHTKVMTSRSDVWASGEWLTVQFHGQYVGYRVHTNGETVLGRQASAEAGAWVMIDDVIFTAPDLVANRALPGFFTHVAEAIIAPG